MSVIDKTVATVKSVDTTAVMDKLEKWTVSMIDVATPIAKQAYEIGLLTLRIDAAQTLIFAFMGVVGIILVVYAQHRVFKWDKLRVVDPADIPMYFPSGITLAGALFAIGVIYMEVAKPFFDIWNWVKLFSPDLWLAHAAIQKVFN